MSIDLDIECLAPFLPLFTLRLAFVLTVAIPFRLNPSSGRRAAGPLHIVRWRLLSLSHMLPKCINIPNRQDGRASLRLHGIHHPHSHVEKTFKRHII